MSALIDRLAKEAFDKYRAQPDLPGCGSLTLYECFVEKLHEFQREAAKVAREHSDAGATDAQFFDGQYEASQKIAAKIEAL